MNDDLYELDVKNGKPILTQVKYSRLVLNFHYYDRPSSAVIYVVTKSYLEEWLSEMDELENKVRTAMQLAATE